MAYAKRTCHECGMIKPVNYMQKKTIKRKTGSSSEKLTAGTMAGFLLDNPMSKKRVQKRIFANNKRGYVRNRDVWVCNSGQCHLPVKEIESGKSNVSSNSYSNGPAQKTDIYEKIVTVIAGGSILLILLGIPLALFASFISWLF